MIDFFSLTRRCSVFATEKTLTGNRTLSSTMGEYSVVYVTTPNQDVAKKIAHGLVSKKLAACANIVPTITSIYEWENKINEDTESLMMIKTKTSKVEEITDYVKANHPYKVCEVIAFPFSHGNKDYLKWIDDVLSGSV
ncbi:hypothetical protein ABEB36_008484 [Hypothenemus hampei]|uniref:Uncharacterized protein n=1 Tax=Hypothenemus hampei TaxID=57062 RepID=A0ABD1EM16_HYPHA